jgi:hypothetical protein
VLVSSAEREPADAVVVNAYTRVKGSVAFSETFCVTVNEIVTERVNPRTKWAGSGKYRNTIPAVGKIQIEMSESVLLHMGEN